MDKIQSFKSCTSNNFEFSDFQTKACLSIVQDKHVLVTAHTGSGKTLPAEFSIYYNIKIKGKKVIYTSPIKALSNQKYKEFSIKFPDIEVGILNVSPVGDSAKVDLNAVITINEARKMLGLEMLDDGRGEQFVNENAVQNIEEDTNDEIEEDGV